VLDPEGLYELGGPLPDLDQPVLVHAMTGFIDAGAGRELARNTLMGTLGHEPLVTFDVDQLFDYRARRPPMLFLQDHWESYADPVLALHVLHDRAGTPFLLLDGPEPDVQWERFTVAVRSLVRRLGVRLTVGVNAIPMAVPHTRPSGITAHATRSELVTDYEPWINAVQVPASAGHLLEYRLGQAGHDAVGFAVHVPHYVAQMEYPAAAEALLEATARVSGLQLPTEDLRAAAERVRSEIDAQVEQSSEVASVVAALESQYDAFVADRGRDNLLADGAAKLPTADELGAELERFLAERARGGEAPER